ncbi:MAG: hypothetical protein ACXVA9_09360 [Bdellovibrionales bacterium]
MKRIIFLVSILLTQNSFANSSSLQYVDGLTAKTEVSATLAKYKSVGTTPARINHKNVFVPCGVSLTSQVNSSEIQLTINHIVKSFTVPSGSTELLKETLDFNGEYPWSQVNYSWSPDGVETREVSLSQMESSLVVVIDSAKCALPVN